MSRTLLALGSEGFGPYDVVWSVKGPSLSPSSAGSDGYLLPGFVDIHIHGAFGIDFMSASMEDMNRLCGLLAEEGYEGFLPTTVTASQKDVANALSNLPENEMILGIHLEGPFISSLHPGAQPPSCISKPPTGGAWQAILEHPRLRLITLAPELSGADAFIKKLVAAGVWVSMGHSDATFAQGEQAVDAGASHATHTFNAMRGFHHREVGLAGVAMLDDRVFAELIYDRIHVSEPAAQLLVKSKPFDKLVAVSDCTMAARMPAGQKITMWGLDCITSPCEVRLASNGALAGSAITLLNAFRNLLEDFGPETAIRACSLNPRLSIGMHDKPRIWLEFSRTLELREIRKVNV